MDKRTTMMIVKRRERELRLARRRERIAQERLESALRTAQRAGNTITELGEEIGVSHQRVSQLIEKAELARIDKRRSRQATVTAGR